jgi:hypothetical protein
MPASTSEFEDEVKHVANENIEEDRMREDALNARTTINIVANGKRGPSSAQNRLRKADILLLEDKLKITDALVEEFSTMGGRPARKIVVRRRLGSTAADFLSALECLREFVDGKCPEGGIFLTIYCDKNREPIKASGPVWSGDAARGKGAELAGALAEVELKKLPKKERMRFYRETLFDALGPANSDECRVIATDELRDIFEKALANVPGSAETSELPHLGTTGPSGNPASPALPAEAETSPAAEGMPISKLEDDGRSAGGDDVLDPVDVDERAAERRAGDGHGHLDNAAGHEAERESDRHDAEGGGHDGDADAHDEHVHGEGCRDEGVGPAMSPGSQLSLRMPSARMKRRGSSPKRMRRER